MYQDLRFSVVEVYSWRCLGLSSIQAVLNFMYAVSVCLFVCVCGGSTGDTQQSAHS